MNEAQVEDAEDLLAVATVDPAVLASKRVVFIGALPEEATVTMVRAAMIPFGDIKSVDMVCTVFVLSSHNCICGLLLLTLLLRGSVPS